MVDRRRTVASLAALAAVGALVAVAAGCGSTSSAASAPATTAAGTTTTGAAAGFAAFQACLKQHGITVNFGGRGFRRPGAAGGTTPTPPPAGQTTTTPRPGGFGGGGNPAFAKYTACLRTHGVTFGSTSPNSTTYKKATAACRSLLPSAPAGTTTTGKTT